MKGVYLTVFILMALIVSPGCSGSNSNTAEANANIEQPSPFAHITDPKEALAEGDRLFDDNQTELAIEAYRQAVKLDPDLADAHFKLGIAYGLIESQIEQAAYTGDATSIPGEGDSGKGKSSSQKAFEKAVEAYKKWLEANPKDDVAQFNLGRSYNKLNKDDKAEDAFREAVKLKPEDSEYQTELGAILVKLAKYQEALDPLKKAVDQDPENSRAADLLEDAEAGRKRINFSQPANDAKANSNANANANTASNANSSTKPVNAAPKPTKETEKDKAPPRPANKPK